MARLIVALVILVIVLIARFIYWLVERSSSPPSVRLQSFHGNQWQGGMGYGGANRPMMGGPFQQGASAYPQQGPSAYPQQGPSAWPQQGVPGQPPPGALRLVARPECTFDRLADCMSRAGLRVAVPPGQMVAPGEPSTALWQNESAQVKYTFDPRTYLRSLEVTGPGAQQIQQGLVSLAGLPALDAHQILALLSTPQPRDQILGLTAAEFLGPGQGAQIYSGQINVLVGSAVPDVAQAAYRAQLRISNM